MLWLCALCRLNGPAYCNDKDFQWHWGFTYFFYLFVFIQERILFWLRILKCKSIHALRLWCQRYRAWWWMYSYSRLQNWLYDLAQCVSLLYRFSVPELQLKRSELTHSILSLFSHSLPPLYFLLLWCLLKSNEANAKTKKLPVEAWSSGLAAHLCIALFAYWVCISFRITYWS